MELKITWVNYNSSVDGIRLYRAEAPIDVDDLPEVLTELSSDATQYIDGNVEQGKMYYYRVCFHKGTDQAFGKNIPVRAIGYNGPGPQEIFSGDWDMGYFGVLSGDEFMYYSELHQKYNLSGTAVTTYNHWIKLAYKGKVIYMPSLQVSTHISYRELYDKGLVYGTDDFGKVIPSGSTGVNQRTIIGVKGSEFVVRLPQCYPDDAEALTQLHSWGYMAGNPGSNEWDDIIGAITTRPRWFNEVVRYNNQLTNFKNELGYHVHKSSEKYTLCIGQQHPLMVKSNVLLRGQATYYTSSTSFVPASIAVSVTQVTASINYSDANYPQSSTVIICWRPFLELSI